MKTIVPGLSWLKLQRDLMGRINVIMLVTGMCAAKEMSNRSKKLLENYSLPKTYFSQLFDSNYAFFQPESLKFFPFLLMYLLFAYILGIHR